MITRFQIRTTGFAIFLLFAPLFLYANPVLYVPQASHTFETLPEGSTIQHRFLLKNTGSSELRILRVDPG
ncbi:DUF1573 domain-containing protein [Desulfobotulus sp. H1]|uniref:DUF1573 domain-containing protein n=3 Tax=Desulfobotulus pelophilus TaxID=2823377 RepID=A0ABT3N721_9BACT|nr:DUF1573 domain-containing protein [Desulfobotulus pelophilus]